MKQAIELFGFLILTVLGFVLPIMAILLSLFQEGISKLTTQYETEKSQSENNIKQQLKKLAETNSTDMSAIQESLKELESIKKKAEAKLSYLNPKKQIIRLFIPLIFAFLGVVVTFLLIDTNIYYSLFLLVSVTGFAYALVILWKLIGILVEVRKTVDIDIKDRDTRTIELLSALVEKGEETEQYFLRGVYVSLDGKDVKDDSRIITITTNTKREVGVGIGNDESRMAKNVQIGLILPTNFIIEKGDYHSIYRDTKRQIVRYQTEFIHGRTARELDTLIITPLEQGSFDMMTFVKAENVEATYRNVTLKVT